MPGAMSMLSVILHCDLDCFYAQVERQRLNLPEDTALAVVQWNSVLAVSYPARKYGVKRGSTVANIRQMAGDAVIIVSVDTISSNTQSSAATVPTQQEQQQNQTQGRQDATVANIATDKVTLARYREASARVFASIAAELRNTAPSTAVERASIDEAYIDVTAEVTRRLTPASTAITAAAAAATAVAAAVAAMPEATDTNMHVANGLTLDPTSSLIDARLFMGSVIARELRARVYADCGYTMSAGISVNKMVSKFASAQHKPNAQTVVPPAAIAGLLQSVPLKRLRGLGGKLGRAVEAMGVATAGEARGLTMPQLQEALGSERRARFVHDSVRGVDNAPVLSRDLNNSLLAAKSFAMDSSLRNVEMTWLPMLAQELADRLADDARANERDARTLTVSFRATLGKESTRTPSKGTASMTTASRSTGMPTQVAGRGQMRANSIAEAAIAVLRAALEPGSDFMLPISFVGLAACNFVQRTDERERISSFFSPSKDDAGAQHGKQRMDSEGVGAEEAHERRVQERKDREVALRLHREESLRGVRKVERTGSATGSATKKGSGSAERGRKGAKGKTKAKGLAGVGTVDSFFKRKEQ